MSEHIDIVVDIETLGTTSGSAILSIGAVTDTVERNSFYSSVDISQTKGTIDLATVKWWLKQSDDARSALTKNPTTHLFEDMLYSFSAWLKYHTADENYTIWGNSARFDLGLLEASYKMIGAEVPWSFRNEGCYRTLKNLYRDIPFTPPTIPHSAIHDAMAEMRHLKAILREMTQ